MVWHSEAMKLICRCCEGHGSVLTVMGELRPCSRCSVERFETWLVGRSVRPQSDDARKKGE
jgi:hypothetical protein